MGKKLKLESVNLDNIYDAGEIHSTSIQVSEEFGSISEKEKFHVAKDILLGLALLYALTLLVYAIHPERGEALIDVCKVSLPPLATLILVFYFRESPERKD